MVVFYFVLDMAITNSYIYLGLLGVQENQSAPSHGAHQEGKAQARFR